MLCGDIHRTFHEKVLIRERIQWRSLYQLAEILEIKIKDTFDSDPMPVFRTIIRELKENGIIPDGFKGRGGNK
jgi:hypothetical protein